MAAKANLNLGTSRIIFGFWAPVFGICAERLFLQMPSLSGNSVGPPLLLYILTITLRSYIRHSRPGRSIWLPSNLRGNLGKGFVPDRIDPWDPSLTTGDQGNNASSLGADIKELLPALVSGHATTAIVAVKRRTLQQLLPRTTGRVVGHPEAIPKRGCGRLSRDRRRP